MRTYYLFVCLFSIYSFGQKQDSLAKYSINELLKKCEYSSTKDSKLRGVVYCNAILKRNFPDTLKKNVYFDLGCIFVNAFGFDKKAIPYFNKSLEEAIKSNSLDFQIYNYQQLAFLYLTNNEFEKSLDFVQKMKTVSSQEQLINNADYFRYQNFSEYYTIIGDYKKAVSIEKMNNNKIDKLLANTSLTKKKRHYLNNIKNGNNIRIVTGYIHLKQIDSSAFYIDKIRKFDLHSNFPYENWTNETEYYLLKKNYDSAIAILIKYKKDIEFYNLNNFTALYYFSLCYQKKKDYQKSLDFAEKALKNKTPSFSLYSHELDLFKLAAEDAKQLGNTTKYNFYSQKYIEGSQKINYQTKAEFAAKLYNQDFIEPLVYEVKKKNSKIVYLFYGLGLLLLVFAGYLGFSIFKTKRDKKRFLEIIAQLEEKKQHQEVIDRNIEKIQEETQGEELESSIKPERQVFITEDTEKKILKQLDNFERKQHFLSPKISLAGLASDFNTNVSYLSNVIKTTRNQNFNSYLHELRIDYIIKKLQTNPEYFNYSIDYLAQESGFASYAVFVRTFIKIKGITPSKFISFLKSNN